MNLVSKIAAPTATPAVGSILAEARARRGYSLADLAETTGLTVAEVAALEGGMDFNPLKIRRAAVALGVVD